MSEAQRMEGQVDRGRWWMLVAAASLPIIDSVTVIGIRSLYGFDAHISVLGLYSAAFPVACTFAFLTLLLADRATRLGMIAFVVCGTAVSLANWGFYRFIFQWSSAFDNM